VYDGTAETANRDERLRAAEAFDANTTGIPVALA
jgi:hypothetical protein